MPHHLIASGPKTVLQAGRPHGLTLFHMTGDPDDAQRHPVAER